MECSITFHQNSERIWSFSPFLLSRKIFELWEWNQTRVKCQKAHESFFTTNTSIFYRWSFLLHMKACIHPHPHPVLRHGPKDGQSQSACLTLLLAACTTELPSYSIVTLRRIGLKKHEHHFQVCCPSQSVGYCLHLLVQSCPFHSHQVSDAFQCGRPPDIVLRLIGEVSRMIWIL